MYSMPSRPNTMREAEPPAPFHHGSATKISFTSVSAVPS